MLRAEWIDALDLLSLSNGQKSTKSSAVRCSAARKSRMDLFVPWLLGYQAHIHLAHPTVGCSGQVLHKVRERGNECCCVLSLSRPRIDFMSCGRLEVYRKPNYKHTDRRGCAVQKFYCPANFSCKQAPSTRPLLTLLVLYPQYLYAWREVHFRR